MTEGSAPDHLTTKELAALLRLSERKIYDLAAQGEVPCVRLVGKLLFPRDRIETWIAAARSGPDLPPPLPAIVAGSHDPLLDWALRESGSTLAAYFDGSHDGLDRLAGRAALAAGLHIEGKAVDDAAPAGWNVEACAARLSTRPVALVEFAWRMRGLLVAPGNPHGIDGIAALAGRRVARRQPSAASASLLERLLKGAGIAPHDLAGPASPARTEADIATMIGEGAADAGLGLASVAAQAGLDFVPLLRERFDLCLWRSAAFDPPLRRLLDFLRTERFAQRAARMGGYDVSGAGQIVWNSPAP
ncbi:helix-turn-helix transcriptional regulator [Profundibacterium mesophilum]|uniref:PTS system nitrogen regulatory IIA component n=1 Tax=Profundibacterium mesophilum KAUST100406-0324 TaxID=1037889 RepID=A0A921NSY6_9RHOB|nr:helix-turn-helix transcriptional regulator [Profundibacterium mesophilum]KAF0677372.1 PTS system nitrogen regulatory IIA component [Profundibacterium mesophilum KAUST100406-0324]